LHAGNLEEADALARHTLRIDPLDFWARWLVNEPLSCDGQVKLDLAINLSRAGFFAEAITANPIFSDVRVERYDVNETLSRITNGVGALAGVSFAVLAVLAVLALFAIGVYLFFKETARSRWRKHRRRRF
jgi:disulfide bond formation protein DsbB